LPPSCFDFIPYLPGARSSRAPNTVGKVPRRPTWSGMQADKQLMALELQESRIAGGLLADAMLWVFPDSDALRVEAFKRMSLLEIMAPAAGSSELDSAADAVS
jgi:hypothetical protein